MATANEPVIRAEELSRVYESRGRRITALDSVELTLAPGEMVVVRGRSGSGKTTLLNCLGALDRPTGGEVWLLGRPLARMGERQRSRLRRRLLGFVFQANALLPTYTAAENVDLLLRLTQPSARQRAARVAEVLSLVGLAQWAGHRPGQLSGGQQQRVLIARALAARPALLLADEPTGALDTTTGARMLHLFRNLAHAEGMAVVVATHDPAAADYADRIFSLRDGRLLPAA